MTVAIRSTKWAGVHWRLTSGLALLNLGTEACGSVPGIPSWNWCWRATGEMLNAHAFDWLRQLTKSAKRAGVPAEVHAPDQQAEAAP